MTRIFSYILQAEGRYIIPHWPEKPKKLVYGGKKRKKKKKPLRKKH